jgi:hypothetical protein
VTIFMCPPDDDEFDLISAKARPSFRESVISIQQSLLQAQAEERRLSASASRAITFRIPVELLERLDFVAEDAATGRSHLLRQIVAEYLCYVSECDIRYKGSMLTAHSSKRKR